MGGPLETESSDYSGRRLIALGVITVALSIGVFAGPGIGVAAASEDVSVDRDNATAVTVSVDADAITPPDGNASSQQPLNVSIGDRQYALEAELNATDDRYVATVPVRDAADADIDDPGAATVEIRHENASVGEDAVDLRYVEFGESDEDGTGLTYDTVNETLRIDVIEAAGFDGETVTLEATWNGDSETFEATVEDAAVTVDRAEFDDSLGDHTDVPTTFRVTVGGEDRTVAPITVERDFRLGLSVAFVDGLAWTDGGRLVVPLDPNESEGLGDAVTVSVSDGESERLAYVEGTVTDGSIELERSDLADLPELTETLSIDVETIAGSVADSPASLEPELRVVDGDLVLWHPLLEAEEEYTLAIDGTANDTETRYVSTVTASQDGVLDVPQAVLGADAVGVELSRNGTTTAFEELEVVPVHSLEGELEDERTVSLETSLERLEVNEIALVGNGSRSRLVEWEIDGSKLSVGEAVAGEHELLLSTAAGPVEITGLESATADDKAAAANGTDSKPATADEQSTSMIEGVLGSFRGVPWYGLLFIPILLGAIAGVAVTVRR